MWVRSPDMTRKDRSLSEMALREPEADVVVVRISRVSQVIMIVEVSGTCVAGLPVRPCGQAGHRASGPLTSALS